MRRTEYEKQRKLSPWKWLLKFIVWALFRHYCCFCSLMLLFVHINYSCSYHMLSLYVPNGWYQIQAAGKREPYSTHVTIESWPFNTLGKRFKLVYVLDVHVTLIEKVAKRMAKIPYSKTFCKRAKIMFLNIGNVCLHYH